MRLVLVALVCGAYVMGEERPTAAALLDRAILAEKEVEQAGRQYAYHEEKRDQQIGKDGTPGALETTSFDVIPLEGETYRKLIRLNGKPLNAEQQKKVDADLAKTREQRRMARRLGGMTHLERSAEIGGLEELRLLFDNRVTGEEIVGGRPVWVVASTPKVDQKLKDHQRAQVLGWRHTSWIDKETGVRAQWRDVVIRDVNGFKPGTEVMFRRDLGQEGVWLLREKRLFLHLQAFQFVHGRVRAMQTFSDFHKFDVTSTITVEEQM